MLEATADLADRVGVKVAVSAGADNLADVAQVVDGLGCPALGVAVDTALQRPGLADSDALRRTLAALHLRDGRRRGDIFEETALGAGDVDFAELVGVLAQAEYAGAWTVRNDSSRGPVDGLAGGREYVASLLPAV